MTNNPSLKQLNYLRGLLADIGIVDPDHDPQFPKATSRILGAAHHTTATLDRDDASRLIEACKEYLAPQHAKIHRTPAAFTDPDNDPWVAPAVIPSPPEPTPPARIRYAGHTYTLEGPAINTTTPAPLTRP